MINARVLGLMKASSFLINTARGSLIDEEDLVDDEARCDPERDHIDERVELGAEEQRQVGQPHPQQPTDGCNDRRAEHEVHARMLHARRDRRLTPG